jgi:hypothetical protein
MTRSASSTRRNSRVRCAIYTRKSSEEGLDQEFNSLQRQRETCEAFIKSQRHEGWVCLPAWIEWHLHSPSIWRDSASAE